MHTTIQTPAGPFTIVARGDAVLAAGFTPDVSQLLPLVHPSLRDGRADADLDLIVKATEAYFDGDLAAIDAVPVTQHSGGGFLAPAWETLRTVKAGAPVTYTEYARLTGRPAAVRAAAQACARNAAALFVPCHRVVRTDGTLGGYRWGLDVKRWLLEHEWGGTLGGSGMAARYAHGETRS
jgi:methylated-DNA-[protein]-cysteine S-methyltransferase